MIKANQEVIDKLLIQTDDFGSDLKTIVENLNCEYRITNYAVSCDNQLVVFCGSDIMHADNIVDELKKIFPDKNFVISEEFLSIC